MRRVLLPIVVVLLALQAAGGPEEPPLRGVVLDPEGNPLAGATVTLRGRDGRCVLVPGFSFLATTTDDAGRYTLPRPPRPMDLSVDHPDFARTTAPAREGGVVRLGRPCYLEGRVPSDAEVFVAQGLRQLAATRTAGGFRLGPLPAGESVTLHVLSPRHRPYQRVLTVEDGAAPIDVHLDEGLSLRGRVTPPRAGVVLRASQGEARESSATTDENGEFLLTGLKKGEVSVVCLAEGLDPLVVRANAGGHVDVELRR